MINQQWHIGHRYGTNMPTLVPIVKIYFQFLREKTQSLTFVEQMDIYSL